MDASSKAPEDGPTVWIDGDGLPAAVRDVLFRAAMRREVPTVIVANRAVRTPRSKWIRSVQVAAGFDVADEHIVESCQPGDLVITGDIPLAAQAIARGATVLQHRGEELDERNVQQRLAMRDMLDELRGGGVTTGGPPPYSSVDKQRFANALDRFLTALGR